MRANGSGPKGLSRLKGIETQTAAPANSGTPERPKGLSRLKGIETNRVA